MIAAVGTLSGPAGATLRGGIDGVRVWAKHVNARGGVSGHAVNLIVYDDGGDLARHRAQVQEAIEARQVIAFVANIESVAGRGSVDYVNHHGVPVIGSAEAAAPWMYESPMYFPQASTADLMFAQGIYSAAARLLPAGKTKMATMTCAEFADCANTDKVWAAEGAAVGFEVVYRVRSSVAAPDFTAECLSARNAGAQVFMVGMDPNSVSRVAMSCARQGYRPAFGSVSSIITDRMKDDPNLDGMVASSNVFPYFQTETPATDEFQQAVRSYGGGLTPGVGLASGWVAAKMFEKAAQHLPEKPTAEAVLQGLWAFRGDTLGQITQPLSFSEGATAPRVQCWYNIMLTRRAWVSTDDYTLNCR